MDRETVSLARCGEYDRRTVEESVGHAFELLGGASSIARPGESVFVKANNVIAADPGSGIVTHPEVLQAVVRQFMKVTEDVTVGDSPGGPFTAAMLKRVYNRTGLAEVARETGARLALDTDTVEVPFPDGVATRRILMCRSMIEADCLVSVSKFKAHRFMNVTGPIKNLYGSVPGTTKFVYHSRFEDPAVFANLVIDVHLAAGARFHVLDAVEAVHGEGSRGGELKKLGFVSAGRNAFAVEGLTVELAGLRPEDDRVLAAAIERGACGRGTGWFAVVGDTIEPMAPGEFNLPARNYFSERAPASVVGWLNRFTSVTPRPVPGECTGCGVCAEACPRGAIAVRDGLARVDARKCIRCFCCDELCERQAVGVRRPLLLKIAGRR